MSLILLRIQDSPRIVFQRRDHNTDVYPGLLTFFGGRIDGGESPREACIRELSEETSLREVNLTEFEPLLLDVPFTLPNSRVVQVHLFSAKIHDADFSTFEGAGAEVFTIDEVLIRSDVAEVARLLLQRVQDLHSRTA
jgi:8-oxo-dGTP pyrophosphatase MutT (NUDIX family)